MLLPAWPPALLSSHTHIEGFENSGGGGPSKNM